MQSRGYTLAGEVMQTKSEDFAMASFIFGIVVGFLSISFSISIKSFWLTLLVISLIIFAGYFVMLYYMVLREEKVERSEK